MSVWTDAGRDVCDHVVLAAPPSVWGDRIEVDGAPIPEGYRMQTGPAVKFFTAVDGRFWGAEDRDPSGMAAMRLAVPPHAQGETWEGTDGQDLPSGRADLTVFSGGPAAAEAVAKSGEGKGALAEWYGGMLETLFPGYAGHRLGTKPQLWPLEEWIATGYSCPAPGQVTGVGPLLAQPFHGRLVFAGEHACPAFFGYMEGALESGLLATGLLVGRYGDVADALDAAAGAESA